MTSSDIPHSARPSIAQLCPGCKNHFHVFVRPQMILQCPHCGQQHLLGDLGRLFDICPLCNCKQFYIQKDFNRILGCL